MKEGEEGRVRGGGGGEIEKKREGGRTGGREREQTEETHAD